MNFERKSYGNVGILKKLTRNYGGLLCELLLSKINACVHINRPTCRPDLLFYFTRPAVIFFGVWGGFISPPPPHHTYRVAPGLLFWVAPVLTYRGVCNIRPGWQDVRQF